MRTYTLSAAAKINLYLEIIGDRPDGYHELAMVMQSIDLCDRVELHPNGQERFKVQCDHPEVPADAGNLAYRAAVLMAKEFPATFARYGGATIHIEKQIPVGAGLAGGSTNAAAVLTGLDLMWGLGLTQTELQDLAAQLGSDIPFCVSGGTALATGRGECLSPLTDLDDLWVVLAKYRTLSVSTAWAYQAYRHRFHHQYIRDQEGQAAQQQQVHSGPLVMALTQRDYAQIGQLLRNDLERVVFPAHPAVQDLKTRFLEQDVLGAAMSGSGPTVFALVLSQSQALQVRDTIEAAIPDPNLDLWVARCATTSIQIQPLA